MSSSSSTPQSTPSTSSTASMHPNAPPPLYEDFQFSFDPSLHASIPALPFDVPPSADLFSQNETNALQGFLDNFSWDADPSTFFDQALRLLNTPDSVSDETTAMTALPSPPPASPPTAQTGPVSRSSSTRRSPGRKAPNKSLQSITPSDSTSPIIIPVRTKPVLSTPQKRLNHIMSEQKRRNAIRDGYATLTMLLAPAGAPPGTGMPTRGRPKGSGRGRKPPSGQGKCGVLFRAIEYVRFLEDSCASLRKEVHRLESEVKLAV